MPKVSKNSLGCTSWLLKEPEITRNKQKLLFRVSRRHNSSSQESPFHLAKESMFKWYALPTVRDEHTRTSAESQELHSCNNHSRDSTLILSVGRQMHQLRLSTVLMFVFQSSFPLTEQSRGMVLFFLFFWRGQGCVIKKIPTATISLALSYCVPLMARLEHPFLQNDPK